MNKKYIFQEIVIHNWLDKFLLVQFIAEPMFGPYSTNVNPLTINIFSLIYKENERVDKFYMENNLSLSVKALTKYSYR